MSPRVLIVEDEPQLRRALVVRLTAAGFACETASHGQEGLEHIARQLPDLVIADLMMPQMDGCEMIQRLKTAAQTAGLPIIVLTAVSDPARRPAVEQFPGVRVMHKPFDSEMLVLAMKELLACSQLGGRTDG